MQIPIYSNRLNLKAGPAGPAFLHPGTMPALSVSKNSCITFLFNSSVYNINNTESDSTIFVPIIVGEPLQRYYVQKITDIIYRNFLRF